MVDKGQENFLNNHFSFAEFVDFDMHGSKHRWAVCLRWYRLDKCYTLCIQPNFHYARIVAYVPRGKTDEAAAANLMMIACATLARYTFNSFEL